MALGKKKNEESEHTIYAEPEELTAAEQNLLQWRQDVLERAGATTAVAKRIAKRLYVDLHEAEKLKKEGCGDELLLRICR